MAEIAFTIERPATTLGTTRSFTVILCVKE